MRDPNHCLPGERTGNEPNELTKSRPISAVSRKACTASRLGGGLLRNGKRLHLEMLHQPVGLRLGGLQLLMDVHTAVGDLGGPNPSLFGCRPSRVPSRQLPRFPRSLDRASSNVSALWCDAIACLARCHVLNFLGSGGKAGGISNRLASACRESSSWCSVVAMRFRRILLLVRVFRELNRRPNACDVKSSWYSVAVVEPSWKCAGSMKL